MATWGDIAHAAGMELSVTSAGGSFDSVEQTYVLRRLRFLVDSWIIKGWVFPIFGYKTVTKTVVDAEHKNEWVVGNGAGYEIRFTQGTPLRLHSIMLGDHPLIQTDYLSLLKEHASSSVSHFFYELQSSTTGTNLGADPFGVIRFNRDVSAGDVLTVAAQNFLMPAGALDYNTTAPLLPGHERLLVFHLALELANTYEKDNNNYARIKMTADELMSDAMELNKDLFTAVTGTMVKSTVPGTDAKLKGSLPLIGPPLQGQQMNRDR